MKAEIIIPTKDRPDDLQKTINSILKQSCLPSTIIIVDAGTTKNDYSAVVAEAKKKNVVLKVIFSKPGLTYQRNLAISFLDPDSDIIIFFDDDVELEETYISSILQVFEEDIPLEIGGVTGKILNGIYKPSLPSKVIRKMFLLSLPSKGEILPSGFVNMINYSLDEKAQVSWLSGCNMAYRKEVFLRYLFDENLKIYASEDFDFSFRVGKMYKLLYVPTARLFHNCSPQSRLSQGVRSGMFIRGINYLFKKNMPQTFKYKLCHYWALNGLLIQKIFLERSFSSFKEALKGYLEIIFMNNYTMPNPWHLDNPKFR